MADWFDNKNQGVSLISFVARRLTSLSNAFTDTGNERMAEELQDYSTYLVEAKECIEQATTIALNEIVASTQQSSINMLKAAIAGAGIDPDTVIIPAQE